MVRIYSRQGRRDERGFTLIEIMIVVVIVAVLAAIAVPVFFGEAKKAKAKSEVGAMIAELGSKEERFKNEATVYRAVAACPATPSNADQVITTCQTGADWLALGVLSPNNKLKCSYEVIVGIDTDDPATL
ncbi:MAG: prepilin-type N-terminal cleavage/methylation domain-containing protein, partial [Deltaproteobacteria bacterium]|nr:prepilin-type N-terminal cleavage/methylation domain-containing protein [Deltaproteobacteria bacterium]